MDHAFAFAKKTPCKYGTECRTQAKCCSNNHVGVGLCKNGAVCLDDMSNMCSKNHKGRPQCKYRCCKLVNLCLYSHRDLPRASSASSKTRQEVPIRDTGPRPRTHDSYSLELAKKAEYADRAAHAAHVAHTARAAAHATAHATAHTTLAPRDFHIEYERELRDLRMQREREQREREQRELHDLRMQRERDERELRDLRDLRAQRVRGYHPGMIVSHGMPPPFSMQPQVMFGRTPPLPQPGLHVHRFGYYP